MLAKAGADVAINYVSHREEAEKVVSEVKSLGKNSLSVKADVSKKAEIEEMMKLVVGTFGKLDILVNNSGVLGGAPVVDMKEEDWDRILSVNLKGQFLCAQAAARQFIAKSSGGRIINLSSVASGGVGFGAAGFSNYSASKGGVIGFTESLAGELGPKGIRVNAIAPGLIESDMVSGITANKEVLAGILVRVPVGRVGKPEDIGAMAVFLASDESDYCNGATFYVDGGWLAT
ncbi:MAG: 3-oxoacyl-(Acyl-carrier-protein) reductase [Candidatus Gottesmanbacteria bacterium GW2011_GWA2_41_12]|nr:MAG: 3-oxoacyl-(Acyl-carrier-protein) reductase [Candidatus Gottesmanbacteria bacterium GW2011_GWA2_41_12]